MKRIGDLVRLKSGGSIMTVTSYDKKSLFVGCDWHSIDGTPFESLYLEDSLEEFVLKKPLAAADGS